MREQAPRVACPVNAVNGKAHFSVLIRVFIYYVGEYQVSHMVGMQMMSMDWKAASGCRLSLKFAFFPRDNSNRGTMYTRSGLLVANYFTYVEGDMSIYLVLHNPFRT